MITVVKRQAGLVFVTAQNCPLDMDKLSSGKLTSQKSGITQYYFWPAERKQLLVAARRAQVNVNHFGK